LIPTWLEGKAQRGHLERWLAWAIEVLIIGLLAILYMILYTILWNWWTG